MEAIVRPRGRGASPVETAREAERRKKLLRFLDSDTPAWKDADHPELGRSAAAFVRELWQDRERKRERKAAGVRQAACLVIPNQSNTPRTFACGRDEGKESDELVCPVARGMAKKRVAEKSRGP
jgi:hypothetical protein